MVPVEPQFLQIYQFLQGTTLIFNRECIPDIRDVVVAEVYFFEGDKLTETIQIPYDVVTRIDRLDIDQVFHPESVLLVVIEILDIFFSQNHL